MNIFVNLILLLPSVLLGKFVKSKRTKDTVFLIFVALMMIFHFSGNYNNYSMFLIVHPCHYAFWSLVLISLLIIGGKQNTKCFRWAVLATVLICIAGYGNNFENHIMLNDGWRHFSSPMAHLFMTSAGVFLIIANYVKIPPSAFIAQILGVCIALCIAGIDYLIPKLAEENPMFLLPDGHGVLGVGLYGLALVPIMLVIGCAIELFNSKRQHRKFDWQWDYLFPRAA